MDHIFLYLFTCFAIIWLVNSQDPRVSSKLGEIIGKTETVDLDSLQYRDVHKYLGIPFAQPPVGDRRFRKPEPKTYLDSPFYAQRHGAICPQNISYVPTNVTVEENEDCLFLNVYVPDRPADKSSGHAVFVWVYGGGFQEGAADFYDGSVMALTGNVIVVTFNYRLGAFGFLSTGDENSPGNFGLWDQHLAFQWVHDYIEDFGGDNQRVTIAGGSAGAMSTMQHALNPVNNGLFQRVIAQSGSMSMPFSDLGRDGLKTTHALAQQLGCPISMDELMVCLREKNVEEYLSSTLRSNDIYFAPIVDGEFIKTNTRYISKMSEDRPLEEVEFFRSLDILTGFNAYDGSFMLTFVMDPRQIENVRPTQEEMSKRYLPIITFLAYRKDFKDELMSVLEAQYTNWTNPADYRSIRLLLTKLIGDINFAVPAVDMARLHKKSSASRNYMYLFAPIPSVRAIPTPSWIPGANHADELLFVFGDFGQLGIGANNSWEVDLASKMITYWTNFVKTGDPNSPEMDIPYWPEYSIDTGDYIVLEKTMSGASAKQYLYAEEANFWLEVFPDLIDAVEGNTDDCHGSTSDAAKLNISQAIVSIAVMLMSYLLGF